MFARSLVVLGVISSGQGCGPEYEVKPIDGVASVDARTCDPEEDAAAAPEDRPVAVCGVTPTLLVPIHESAMFYGAGSYDPNDVEIVDYQWRLASRPEGSAAEMPLGGSLRIGFTPDVAGEYVAELVVVNDECMSSDPCQVVLTARPSQALWVEMFWEHPGDDMDLHLVRDDGAYTSEDDCFYGNCVGGGIEWGVAGDWRDDPFLDLDDIPGTGPENINIDGPATGWYTVAVHDYPGSVYYGPNDVTVRIYVGGELAFERTKEITGEDIYVPFAELHWPEAEIQPL